jgi:hypothetical protein
MTNIWREPLLPLMSMIHICVTFIKKQRQSIPIVAVARHSQYYVDVRSIMTQSSISTLPASLQLIQIHSSLSPCYISTLNPTYPCYHPPPISPNAKQNTVILETVEKPRKNNPFTFDDKGRSFSPPTGYTQASKVNNSQAGFSHTIFCARG